MEVEACRRHGCGGNGWMPGINSHWDCMPLGGLVWYALGAAWDVMPLRQTSMVCPWGSMGWHALGADLDGNGMPYDMPSQCYAIAMLCRTNGMPSHFHAVPMSCRPYHPMPYHG
jgi:hypothetical protein